MATACSGSGMPKICATAIQEAANRRARRSQAQAKKKFRTAPALQFKFLWSCEIEVDKAAWIHKIHEADGDNGLCCFKNITELGQRFASCHTHGKDCPVSHSDIFVAGFSCTPCSRTRVLR